MDHLKYANIENEIEVDDSDDDLGNEDDVLFEEQLENMMCPMMLKLGFLGQLEICIRYTNVGSRKNTSINLRTIKQDGRIDLNAFLKKSSQNY